MVFQKGHKINVGKKMSEETKRKLSIAHKGFKHTKETRKKISNSNKGKNHPLYATKRSEEIKIKISLGNKGKIVSEETRRKISKSLTGRKTGNQIIIHHINGIHEDDRPENRREMTNSEHIKLHWRQGNMNVTGRTKGCKDSYKRIRPPHSEETKIKMRGISRNKGIKKSDEVKRRMSLSKRGKKRKPFTSEHKRRISESIKKQWELKRFKNGV